MCIRDRIKALAGPYPNVPFVPTGGVNEKNLVEYLSFPKIAACGGSWMAPDDAIAAQDWPRICALASAAVKNLLNMKLAHVAVNCADAVSYTHLDVYKRQVVSLAAADWESFLPSAHVGCLVRELDSRQLASEVKLRLMEA